VSSACAFFVWRGSAVLGAQSVYLAPIFLPSRQRQFSFVTRRAKTLPCPSISSAAEAAPSICHLHPWLPIPRGRRRLRNMGTHPLLQLQCCRLCRLGRQQPSCRVALPLLQPVGGPMPPLVVLTRLILLKSIRV
jgi:hypothetical protein